MNVDKDRWQQLWQEVVEKKKLDPVGKADADIDNDGDVDKSDDYLHNRRKAIKHAMKKEGDGMKPCPECDGSMENHDPECSRYEKAEKTKMNKEAKDIDAKEVDKALRHDCASHVAHEQWGYGECIKGEHTLVESADGEGYVTHYDVVFEHGVEFNVSVEDLTILRESSHMHKKKKESKEEEETSAVKEETKCEDCNCDPCDCSSIQEGTVAEVEQEIENAYSGIQQAAINAMRKMWTEKYEENPKVKSDREKHVKGSTEPEGMHDKESVKGKEFIDQHKKSDKSIEDLEQKSHDSVFDAARQGKQSPTRQGEKRVGDLKPQIPQDTTKV